MLLQDHNKYVIKFNYLIFNNLIIQMYAFDNWALIGLVNVLFLFNVNPSSVIAGLLPIGLHNYTNYKCTLSELHLLLFKNTVFSFEMLLSQQDENLCFRCTMWK